MALPSFAASIDRGAGRLAGLLIAAYQRLVSARLPAVCIFAPSCSAYARIAFARRGLLTGIPAVAQRLRRCRGGTFQGSDLP